MTWEEFYQRFTTALIILAAEDGSISVDEALRAARIAAGLAETE